MISEFSDDIAITATVVASQNDKQRIVSAIKAEHGLEVGNDFPDEFVFERCQRFKNGDFVANYFSLLSIFNVRSAKQRRFREPTDEELAKLRTTIYGYTPDIAYFPTFVFDFPQRVFLTDRGGRLDAFYRRAFQDILDFDDRGHTIAKDITRRVREPRFTVPWPKFFSVWGQTDDKTKIQHVMDRAGAAVTKLVFGRWNKIFREDVRGKEIVISFEIEEGEVEDDRGVKTKTDKHDIYISFNVRDGTRRFSVNDRSLGFRWFFSFMLFTQFRVARKNDQASPFSVR